MCNCGHEQQSEAKRLKQRSIAAILIALGLGIVLSSVGRAHPPVIFTGIAVQVALAIFAMSLMRRRRRVLCGQA